MRPRTDGDLGPRHYYVPQEDDDDGPKYYYVPQDPDKKPSPFDRKKRDNWESDPTNPTPTGPVPQSGPAQAQQWAWSRPNSDSGFYNEFGVSGFPAEPPIPAGRGYITEWAMLNSPTIAPNAYYPAGYVPAPWTGNFGNKPKNTGTGDEYSYNRGGGGRGDTPKPSASWRKSFIASLARWNFAK